MIALRIFRTPGFFFALSLLLHGIVFTVLIFMPRPEAQKAAIIHPVVIENSEALARRKARERGGGASHNDLTPLLSAEGRKFDPTGIFSIPDFYLTNPSGNPNLTRPGTYNHRGETEGARFSTGFDKKRYTTVEFHEFKVAAILRLKQIRWLENEIKCRLMERQIFDFLNDRIQVKTWYTLGIGSRLPDALEKQELVYYLRRLELKVLEEGSQEQSLNLAATCRIVYGWLNPELKQYWDSLQGNYRLLNDPRRSPEF